MDALLRKLHHEPSPTVAGLDAPLERDPVLDRWTEETVVRRSSAAGGKAARTRPTGVPPAPGVGRCFPAPGTPSPPVGRSRIIPAEDFTGRRPRPPSSPPSRRRPALSTATRPCTSGCGTTRHMTSSCSTWSRSTPIGDTPILGSTARRAGDLRPGHCRGDADRRHRWPRCRRRNAGSSPGRSRRKWRRHPRRSTTSTGGSHGTPRWWRPRTPNSSQPRMG